MYAHPRTHFTQRKASNANSKKFPRMKLFENLSAQSVAQLYDHATANAQQAPDTFAQVRREVRKQAAQYKARTDNAFWAELQARHASNTPTIVEFAGIYAHILPTHDKKAADHITHQLKNGIALCYIVDGVCTPITWLNWRTIYPLLVPKNTDTEALPDPTTGAEACALIKERNRQKTFAELARTNARKRSKRRRIALYEPNARKEAEQAQFNATIRGFREIMQQIY